MKKILFFYDLALFLRCEEDDEGNIHVCDVRGGRIQKYDKNGLYLQTKKN